MQVLDPKVEKLSLKKLANQLKPLGEVSHNDLILNFKVNGHEMVIFPDGQLIFKIASMNHRQENSTSNMSMLRYEK